MKKTRIFFLILVVVGVLLAGILIGKESGGNHTSQEESAASHTSQEEGADSYTSKEEVARYIHTNGRLPDNFITKKEAEKLGWDSEAGNLWEVAPGKSIGGDRFGNYEGLLPDGNYKECDINYEGGYRGPERLVFSDDGRVYYTPDHYKSFEQLY